LLASRVEGLDRLRKKLKAFPAVVKPEIRAAIAKAANDIVAMQKRLVPVKTGGLKDSIQWSWATQDPPAYATLKSGTSIKGDPETTAIITAGNEKVRRAHLVEFGTAPHINAGIMAGTKHPGTNPQPFFYPPFRARKKAAKSGISRAVTKAAKRVAASR
jgi:HK97 gp10 family phage protein